MAQLIEFAGNHWELVAALAVVLVLLAQNLMADSGKNSVSPQQATDLINRKDAVVVDVRPIADYSKAHIINSTNIPANSIKNQLTQLEKHKDKGTPIIVACRSGGQSAAVCSILSKHGYEEVYNLKGGILAWQSAGLPVSRK